MKNISELNELLKTNDNENKFWENLQKKLVKGILVVEDFIQ